MKPFFLGISLALIGMLTLFSTGCSNPVENTTAEVEEVETDTKIVVSIKNNKLSTLGRTIAQADSLEEVEELDPLLVPDTLDLDTLSKDSVVTEHFIPPFSTEAVVSVEGAVSCNLRLDTEVIKGIASYDTLIVTTIVNDSSCNISVDIARDSVESAIRLMYEGKGLNDDFAKNHPRMIDTLIRMWETHLLSTTQGGFSYFKLGSWEATTVVDMTFIIDISKIEEVYIRVLEASDSVSQDYSEDNPIYIRLSQMAFYLDKNNGVSRSMPQLIEKHPWFEESSKYQDYLELLKQITP